MTAIERLSVAFASLNGIEDLAVRQGQRASLAVQQRALDRLLALCIEYGGEVGNTVGSEMLCLFPSPDAALNAACRMQHDIHEDPEIRAPGLSLSMGLHLGPVYRRDGQVFGDSINTAARVRSEAQAGQILLSKEMSRHLHAESSSLLHTYDRVRVKGKERPLTLMQAAWQPTDLNTTSVMAAMINSGHLKDLAADVLDLDIDSEQRQISAAMTPVNVGRGPSCDLRVHSQSASRLHCRIDHRRGKFVLIDLSTNGTHLVRSDGSETIIRREEAVLTGSGRFALGEAASESGRWTIRFSTR